MTLIRTRGLFVTGLLAVALYASVPSAEGAPRRPKLDSALRNSTAVSGLHVIVQTRSGALDEVAGGIRSSSGKVRRFHRLINAASMTITDAELRALEDDGSVLNISVDAVVRASAIGALSPNDWRSDSQSVRAFSSGGSSSSTP